MTMTAAAMRVFASFLAEDAAVSLVDVEGGDAVDTLGVHFGVHFGVRFDVHFGVHFDVGDLGERIL